MGEQLKTVAKPLEKLSVLITKVTGNSLGFVIALSFVLLWLVAGPVMEYSQLWQNVFSMTTAAATFLMVFLLQRANSKDMQAIHLKLNELIASQSGASNRMLNIEHVSEAELDVIKELHDQLPKDSLDSHSVEHARQPEILIAER